MFFHVLQKHFQFHISLPFCYGLTYTFACWIVPLKSPSGYAISKWLNSFEFTEPLRSKDCCLTISCHKTAWTVDVKVWLKVYPKAAHDLWASVLVTVTLAFESVVGINSLPQATSPLCDTQVTTPYLPPGIQLLTTAYGAPYFCCLSSLAVAFIIYICLGQDISSCSREHLKKTHTLLP